MKIVWIGVGNAVVSDSDLSLAGIELHVFVSAFGGRFLIRLDVRHLPIAKQLPDGFLQLGPAKTAGDTDNGSRRPIAAVDILLNLLLRDPLQMLLDEALRTRKVANWLSSFGSLELNRSFLS